MKLLIIFSFKICHDTSAINLKRIIIPACKLLFKKLHFPFLFLSTIITSQSHRIPNSHKRNKQLYQKHGMSVNI